MSAGNSEVLYYSGFPRYKSNANMSASLHSKALQSYYRANGSARQGACK